MAQVLSSENQELLRIIEEKKQESLKQLEVATGRKRSNLSRTLKTMSRYGIVDLVKQECFITLHELDAFIYKALQGEAIVNYASP